MPDRPVADAIIRALVDDGRLIEAGWIAFRIAALPPHAPESQLVDMRIAYLAGAQHVFASLVTMLDPEPEETEADLRRMEAIDAEMEAVQAELALALASPRGRA
jgi:hypothetical protein